MIEIQAIKNKFNDKWWEKLSHHFSEPYMEDVFKRIQSDIKKGYKVLPSSNDIFKRFKLINPDDVRVVIITEEPICTYNQSKIWQNMSSWIERECFDGLNLNLEDNMDYLIPQGIINLSPSLTVCNKSDHSNIGWGKLFYDVLNILLNTGNNVLFVYYNPDLVINPDFEVIKLQEGCFKYINEFMLKEYNTKIEW